MTQSILAHINPEILRWARGFMGLDLNYVAQCSGVDTTELMHWESGRSNPTMAQLRKLAKVYDFSIAVFYLPSPPDIRRRRIKDRRFLAGFEYQSVSPELNREFRRAEDCQHIALELMTNVGRKPKSLQWKSMQGNDPEQFADTMRELMNLSYEEQSSWRDPRIAFNSRREKIENLDVLVLQSTDVPLEEMRGYSMFFEVLPVVCVNRKDAFNARSFTLLHEFAHLMLRTESICNLDDGYEGLSEYDRKLEVFCNRVAGCALVPSKYLLREKEIGKVTSLDEEGEKAINALSKTYSASREVIVRRMLDLEIVTDEFYRTKRKLYYKEHAQMKAGYVNPITNALNTVGRSFIGLALENLNRGAITTADFSEFVGIKIKHLDGLRERFLLA